MLLLLIAWAAPGVVVLLALLLLVIMLLPVIVTLLSIYQMKTKRCRILALKMKILQLFAIMLIYFGVEYFSYELMVFLLNIVFCGYIYLRDHFKCAIKEDYWEEEQQLFAKAIDRFGGSVLGPEFWYLMKQDGTVTENFGFQNFRKSVWINQLVEVLWSSQFQPMTEKLLKEFLEEFNVTCINGSPLIGNEPVKILDVESKVENNVDMVIDITASYNGNAVLDTLVDVGFAKIPVKITNIRIQEVKMRLFFSQFDSESTEHPFFSGLKFAFIENPLPNCDWNFHSLAEICIKHIIERNFNERFVLPHKINIPLHHFKKYFSQTIPEI